MALACPIAMGYHSLTLKDRCLGPVKSFVNRTFALRTFVGFLDSLLDAGLKLLFFACHSVLLSNSPATNCPAQMQTNLRAAVTSVRITLFRLIRITPKYCFKCRLRRLRNRNRIGRNRREIGVLHDMLALSRCLMQIVITYSCKPQSASIGLRTPAGPRLRTWV